MTVTRTLNIAGIGVELEMSREIARACEQQWAGFYGGQREYRLVVREVAYPRSPLHRPVRFTATPTGFQLDVPGALDVSIAERTRRGIVTFSRARLDTPESGVPIALRTAMRGLFSLLTVQRGGILLHAAGIVDAGRGLVLAGRSGAGKTTFCSDFPRENILSDELVALFPGPLGPTVDATPFSGSLNWPSFRRRVPLGGLFALGRGDRPEVRALPGPKLLPSILACVALPEHAVPFERRSFLAVADLVTQSSPRAFLASLNTAANLSALQTALGRRS